MYKTLSMANIGRSTFSYSALIFHILTVTNVDKVLHRPRQAKLSIYFHNTRRPNITPVRLTKPNSVLNDCSVRVRAMRVMHRPTRP
jgi:hypothetical protein